MFPDAFITEERIGRGLEVASKKRLLEALSDLLADGYPTLHTEPVFERLVERERLGSTGLGHGVALPHARVKDVVAPIGAFVSLQTGVDYDTADGEPVDLAFALLVPEEATDEHLKLLAQLAGLFSDELMRKRLREADSNQAILRLIESD